MPYQLGDFERLRIVKVIKLPELERDVSTFMSKNNLELEFSGESSGVSSQHEHLRMSTFLALVLESEFKEDSKAFQSIRGPFDNINLSNTTL